MRDIYDKCGLDPVLPEREAEQDLVRAVCLTGKGELAQAGQETCIIGKLRSDPVVRVAPPRDKAELQSAVGTCE